MTETKFLAPDIECDGCASSITKALTRQAGVEQVAVDVASQTVSVRYDDTVTDPEALAVLLDDVGFPAQRV